jgi:hypothetical protein
MVKAMGPRLPLLLVAVLLAGSWTCNASAAGKRRRRKSQVSFSADFGSAPSYRYGKLSRDACHAELKRRKIEFSVVAEARAVLAPVRIANGLRGVVFRTELSRARAATSPWEVFDCRLVLALHDFTAILLAHRIDEVLIYSAWRPPSKKWPADKLARRHPGALAVDMFKFRQRPAPKDAAPNEAAPQDAAPKEAAAKVPAPKQKTPVKAELDYLWLDVKDDFRGKIGAKTCGDGALGAKGDAAKELRALVCEAGGQRLFTSQLTPNYDRAHFNHFHFEITPDVKWQLLR